MRVRTGARIVRRLARERRRWWAALPVTVATALVSTTYLLMQSLTLSPQQLLDRDLGQYGATIGFGTVVVPPGTDDLDRLDRAAARAGVDRALSTMTLLGMRWGTERPVVREADWSEVPLPERYVLAQGTWADAPGEVVVAARDPRRLPALGTRLDLLSGRMPLTVVGVAQDRFTAATVTLLVGPGTWARTPRDTAVAFPTVAAYPVLFWDGSRERAMMREVTGALLPLAEGQQANALAKLVADSRVRAPDVMAEAPQAADRGNSFAFAIPSVTLSLTGALVAAALLLPSLRRSRTLLLDGGLDPRPAALLPVAASTIPLLTGAVVGAGLGVAFALLSRPLLQHWHDQPLSPVMMPFDPLGRAIAAVLLVMALVAGGQARHSARSSSTAAPAVVARSSNIGRAVLELRRWAAVIGFVGFVAILPGTTGPTTAMGLAVCSIITGAALAPDALEQVLRGISDRTLRGRLVKRQLASTPASATTVALTTVVVASAIAFSILLSTMIATMDGRQNPEVLPGQVIVADRGTTVLPVPTGVRKALAAVAELDEATPVPLAFATDGLQGEPGTRMVELDGAPGYLLAVDSVRQARSLLGMDWDEGYASTLNSGGVVRWLDDAESGEQTRTSLLTEHATSTSVEVPSTDRPRPRVDWANGRAGLTLTATLQKLHLPVSRGALVLADAPPTLAAELRRTLRTMGLDQDAVTGYAEPPPPIPNAALLATAALLALTTIAMVAAGAAARVRALRSVAGQLLANGVPPAWTRQSILLQEGILLVVGATIGLVSGSLPVLLAIPRFDGVWDVSVPWGHAAALVAACAGGALAAVLGATRRLRPELAGTS